MLGVGVGMGVKGGDGVNAGVGSGVGSDGAKVVASGSDSGSGSGSGVDTKPPDGQIPETWPTQASSSQRLKPLCGQELPALSKE